MLKLLSNERRLLILCFLLARGEMKVGELVDASLLETAVEGIEQDHPLTC